MKIAVIGGGWYGCHTALELSKKGHSVTIFEKESAIFSGISGKFGIRLHAGPHYPRSPVTRQNCQQNYETFTERYPDLVVPHSYSIYGLGTKDANGDPSKVVPEAFDDVCREFNHLGQVEPESWGFSETVTAHNIEEPSIKLGSPLRRYFERKLANEKVPIHCEFEVSSIEKHDDKVIVGGHDEFSEFDYVVNTTSFKELLPTRPLPHALDVIYQPCLALMYRDTRPKPDGKPFSTIWMDGWFPCIMPYKDGINENTYIITHGKWTIMDSCNEVAEAEELLSSIDDDFIGQHIRPFCEQEMNRFWPEFHERFRYIGWKGSVLAKPKTNTELRAAITFCDNKTNMIHVVPGKVSNVFDVSAEAIAIIDNDNLKTTNDYSYVANGVLDQSVSELKEVIDERATCNLKTHSELIAKLAEHRHHLLSMGIQASPPHGRGYSSNLSQALDDYARRNSRDVSYRHSPSSSFSRSSIPIDEPSHLVLPEPVSKHYHHTSQVSPINVPRRETYGIDDICPAEDSSGSPQESFMVKHLSPLFSPIFSCFNWPSHFKKQRLLDDLDQDESIQSPSLSRHLTIT